MKKVILLIFISAFLFSLSADVVEESRIHVVWDLGTVDVDPSASIDFLAYDTASGISNLDLSLSGMKASGRFYISFSIVSLSSVNISIYVPDGAGAMTNGTSSIDWSLSMLLDEELDAWETGLDKESYSTPWHFYTHYPSTNGISSSGNILFEIETENLLMLEDTGTYKTQLKVEVEGI